MLQMVACGRGVAALPRWLVVENQSRFPLVPIHLGKNGIGKQIFLGIRRGDIETDYVAAFVELARTVNS